METAFVTYKETGSDGSAKLAVWVPSGARSQRSTRTLRLKSLKDEVEYECYTCASTYELPVYAFLVQRTINLYVFSAYKHFRYSEDPDFGPVAERPLCKTEQCKKLWRQ
jgi:hypothetical protein